MKKKEDIIEKIIKELHQNMLRASRAKHEKDMLCWKEWLKLVQQEQENKDSTKI